MWNMKDFVVHEKKSIVIGNDKKNHTKFALLRLRKDFRNIARHQSKFRQDLVEYIHICTTPHIICVLYINKIPAHWLVVFTRCSIVSERFGQWTCVYNMLAVSELPPKNVCVCFVCASSACVCIYGHIICACVRVREREFLVLSCCPADCVVD